MAKREAIIPPITVRTSLELQPLQIQILELQLVPISFPYRSSQNPMAMDRGSTFWNPYNGFVKITMRITSKS